MGSGGVEAGRLEQASRGRRVITDAQILTIARELYAAEQAMKDAKAAKDEATRKADSAATLVTERTASVQRLRAKLLELAAMKPAEPAPKPEPVSPAPLVDKAEVVRQSRLAEAAAKAPSSSGPTVPGPVPTLNAKRK